MLDLSCIMWDLSLWPMDSLVAARAAQYARAQSPHGVWDLSSRTRDQTHVCFIGRWNLNHWTTREIPLLCFYREATQLSVARVRMAKTHLSKSEKGNPLLRHIFVTCKKNVFMQTDVAHDGK